MWGPTEFDAMAAVGIFCLGTVDEEESVFADRAAGLGDIEEFDANPGGPGVPGAPGIMLCTGKDGAVGIQEVAGR